MEVVYSKWGIGNNFGDFIELNENLKNYPKLHKAILAHEMSHTSDSGFTKKDLILDLSENRISNSELMKFIIKHPRSLVQFSPIYKKYGIFYYDINMIIIWLFTFGLISLTVFLSLK
jgi:hypothetical protein